MADASDDQLLKQILLARVYDVAIESPLEPAPRLSRQLGTNIYLKREDLQPVNSFKLRGAYNKIMQLSKSQRQAGVIAASAGNHAQGVALSAKKLGIPATIVMPKTTPSIKVEAVRSYGGKVVLHGDSYTDAFDHCQKLIKTTGATFIHPFDDPLVIAGQGTVGSEILEQLPRVTHIFVPVGGGGLISGIGAYVKQLQPDVKIIGVEPVDSNAMQQSIKQDKRVSLDHVGIFADGVAVKQVGELTFRLAKQYVDDIVTVTTDQICAGIKAVFEETRSIVEPAGALAAAASMNYELPESAHVVAICSGANVSFERLQQIAERTQLGSGKEVLCAVTMPEKPGALQTFCSQVVNGHNITGFSYRLNKRRQAHVLVSISVAGDEDKTAFTKKMKQYGYEHTDLSEDDVAKEHTRHMIGGPALEAEDEHLYQIDFPERPGAMGDFLAAVSGSSSEVSSFDPEEKLQTDSGWNISAFHYRSTASDTGNVLVGFEAADRSKLEKKLDTTHYEWTRVDENPSLKLFIA